MSYLEQLNRLSSERGDRGMLHGGHIHYIQAHMAEGFALKAAIYAVLANVPDVFPLDLPEQITKDDFEPTEAMVETFRAINQGLIIPIGGGDIAEIIELARAYEALDAADSGDG